MINKFLAIILIIFSSSTLLSASFNAGIAVYYSDYEVSENGNDSPSSSYYFLENSKSERTTQGIMIFWHRLYSTSANYIGLGYLGYPGVLILSKSGTGSNISLTRIIVHELGHNFNLHHPFDSNGGPNPGSCEGADQGTTNRIMDYTSNPEVFIGCERVVASLWCKENFIEQLVHNPSEGAEIIVYDGTWIGTIIVAQPGRVPVISKDLIIEVD